MLEAQREILRAVADKVGGADAARADTLTGAYTALSDALQRGSEQWGAQLTQMLRIVDALNAIAAALNAINDFKLSRFFWQIVIYAATHELISGPSDSPPDQAYFGTMEQAFRIERSVIGSGRIGEEVTIGLGEIRLSNSEGDYDQLGIDTAAVGQPCLIRMGDKSRHFASNWRTVLRGMSWAFASTPSPSPSISATAVFASTCRCRRTSMAAPAARTAATT